jgi:hypothetical protein
LRIGIAAAVALLAALGCGSGTEPPVSLTGLWAYKVSNLTGGGWSCEEAEATMTLTQTGSTFTGNVSDNLVCTVGSQSTFFGPYSGTIGGGTIDGDQVAFDFQTPDTWTSTGTISGRSMSGAATVTLNTSSQTIDLSGQWSATKKYPPNS